MTGMAALVARVLGIPFAIPINSFLFLGPAHQRLVLIRFLLATRASFTSNTLKSFTSRTTPGVRACDEFPAFCLLELTGMFVLLVAMK